MAVFPRALPFILNNEGANLPHGGKCNIPGDSGGRTNCGVSTPALLDLNQRHPEFGFPSDPWDMTMDQIGQFLNVGYWRFDGMQDQACATKICDMDVNAGLPSGILLAQRAAVTLGAEITVDGGYGPATEAALNACDPALLMAALVKVSLAHYDAIVAAHPGDAKFLADWTRRANEVPGA